MSAVVTGNIQNIKESEQQITIYVENNEGIQWGIVSPLHSVIGHCFCVFCLWVEYILLNRILRVFSFGHYLILVLL